MGEALLQAGKAAPDPALHGAKRYIDFLGEFGIGQTTEKGAADRAAVIVTQFVDTHAQAPVIFMIAQDLFGTGRIVPPFGQDVASHLLATTMLANPVDGRIAQLHTAR